LIVGGRLFNVNAAVTTGADAPSSSVKARLTRNVEIGPLGTLSKYRCVALKAPEGRLLNVCAALPSAQFTTSVNVSSGPESESVAVSVATSFSLIIVEANAAPLIVGGRLFNVIAAVAGEAVFPSLSVNAKLTTNVDAGPLGILSR